MQERDKRMGGKEGIKGRGEIEGTKGRAAKKR
jgi:hypothetical protein